MATKAGSLPPLDVTRAPEGGEVGPVQSGWRLALREFAQNRLAVTGVAILVFFVLFSFVGPLIYHGNYLNSDLLSTNLPPGAGHPLGTSNQGYDELALIMNGGQAALEVGFFAATIAIVIGALFGAISGLLGGLVDASMMRVVDVFLSIPGLFIVLIVAVRYGASVLSLSLIIGGFSWLVPARLVRGEVLSLRERDFVCRGARRWLQPVAADPPPPAPERVRRGHRQRHLPGGGRDPDHRLARLPRLRPALAASGLGRPAFQRRRVPAGRLLVADLPGWRLYRAGRHGLQPGR